MAKTEVRRRAIALRRLHKSYSQIKSELGVSKSTLSIWLRDYPLTREEINSLRGRSEIRIERYRKTMQQKRERRLRSYYDEEKKKWLPFSKRELIIAGLFLYWGEGNKSQRNTVSINNTDPQVIKFALYWLMYGLDIPKDRIQVFIHLYSDMNETEEEDYWSKELHIPLDHFAKPYIKRSKRIDLDQKGFGHGTCGIRVFDTVQKEKVLMGLNAIADFYGDKLDKT